MWQPSFKNELTKLSWSLKDKKALSDQIAADIERTLEKELPPGYKAKAMKAKVPFMLSPMVEIDLQDAGGQNPVKESLYGHNVSLTVKKKWFKPEYHIEADSLYLKPEHRKKGIGKATMTSLIEAAKKSNVHSIGLEADGQGKAVWSKIPGVEFANKAEVKHLHKAYKKWSTQHGGPSLSKNAKPSEYPSEFLLQYSPANLYLGYKLKIKD